MKELGVDYEAVEWDNTNTQLWTLTPQGQPGYYIIRNVASGNEVFCTGDGKRYNTWRLNTAGSTMISIDQPYIFLAQQGKEIWCSYNYPGSKSDYWVLTEQSDRINKKFVIENKKTGKVLEETGGNHKMREWENKDSQLWTIKPHGNGYSIVNVATGKSLIYTKNSKEYSIWNLKPSGNTWIQVAGADIFLAHKGTKLVYLENKQTDNSDVWLLADPNSKKVVTTPKPVEDPKEYVIANKKSGQVLDLPQRSLELKDWEDMDSQTWTLEPQDRPGYYVIRNVASGETLAYNKNDRTYQKMKLSIRGDTWIQAEDTNAFLTDLDGDVIFLGYKRYDGSDKWLLTERESRKRDPRFNIVPRLHK